MDTASWGTVVSEAESVLRSESFLSDCIINAILKHATFADAIVALLSNHFASSSTSQEQWASLFTTVYQEGIVYDDKDMMSAENIGLLDLCAVRDRDPAAQGLVNPFLYFKGYKAIQAHRIAHILWRNGRKDVALYVQSRCSELWSVDIHPAAVIGVGLLIDHGTGVVNGETAVVGTNCSFLHDRFWKLSDNASRSD